MKRCLIRTVIIPLVSTPSRLGRRTSGTGRRPAALPYPALPDPAHAARSIPTADAGVAGKGVVRTDPGRDRLKHHGGGKGSVSAETACRFTERIVLDGGVRYGFTRGAFEWGTTVGTALAFQEVRTR